MAGEIKPEVQNWLNLAQEDYETSVYLFQGAKYPWALYTMFQAIEKLLKGLYLKSKDETPPKTHNLINLAKNSKIEFTDNKYDKLETLFTHYNRVRYRDLAKAHYNSKGKTAMVFEQAENLYLWIQKKSLNH